MTTPTYTFNAKDLEDFLREKGFNHRCPICNTSQYGIVPTSDPPTYFYYPVGDGSSNNIGRGYPVVTVICKNCGFMWHFAAEVIQAWYNEKRDVKEVH